MEVLHETSEEITQRKPWHPWTLSFMGLYFFIIRISLALVWFMNLEQENYDRPTLFVRKGVFDDDQKFSVVDFFI